MLKKITSAQEQQLQSIATKWKEITLSGQTDEKALKKALQKIYERGGSQSPKNVYVYDSPLECILHIVSMSTEDLGQNVEPIVASQISRRLGQKVSSLIDQQLRYRVGGIVTEEIGQIGSEATANLVSSLFVSVRNNTWGGIWGTVKANVTLNKKAEAEGKRETAKNIIGNLLDAHWDFWQWLDFVPLYKTVFELTDHAEENEFDGMAAFMEAGAAWTWFYEKAAFVSRMPRIKIDGDGLLHAEDEPAVVYPNGYSLWYKHGEALESKNK